MKVVDSKNLAEVYNLLITYPSVGPFLAYQFSIDLNYSNLCNHDENEFVVPGPGALSGIKKCFKDLKYRNSDVIKFVTESQTEEFEKRNLNFKNLYGRDLKLIDCQNLFCEVDKYARIAHPEVEGFGDRQRIKQKYQPSKEQIDYFFPPKWEINKNID